MYTYFTYNISNHSPTCVPTPFLSLVKPSKCPSMPSRSSCSWWFVFASHGCAQWASAIANEAAVASIAAIRDQSWTGLAQAFGLTPEAGSGVFGSVLDRSDPSASAFGVGSGDARDRCLVCDRQSPLSTTGGDDNGRRTRAPRRARKWLVRLDQGQGWSRDARGREVECWRLPSIKNHLHCAFLRFETA